MTTLKPTFGRSVATTLSSNAVTAVLWLASGILAARLLGPKGRGELAAIQTWGLFLVTFALLGMPDSLVYFSARDPEQSVSYTLTAVMLAFLGGIPLLALAYLILPYLLFVQSPAVIREARFYLVVGVTAILGQIPLNALRGRSDFATWNALRIAGTALWLLPLLLAWALDRRTSEFVASMNLLFWGAAYTLLILLVLPSRIPGPYRPEFSHWKEMLSFGLPSVLTLLPQHLNLRLDQMLMAAVVAPGLLGLYVVGVSWAAIMTPAFQAVAIVLFPHIASRPSREQQISALTRIIRLGSPVAILASCALSIVTPWGLPLIFGAKFAASISAAIVLVFAGGVLGINQLLEEGLRGLGSPKAAMWSEFGGLIVTATLLWLLLKPMGIMGAAVASLAGYTVVALQLVYWTTTLTASPLSELLLPRGQEMIEIYERTSLWVRGLLVTAK